MEKRKILIVDDEEAILFAFKDFLSGTMLTVDTATSYAEVKQLLESPNPYHGAVVDLRLCGTKTLDGFDVITLLKKQNPQCKIIVATAYAQKGTKEKAFNLGVDYFMEKPISPGEISKIFQSMGAC